MRHLLLILLPISSAIYEVLLRLSSEAVGPFQAIFLQTILAALILAVFNTRDRTPRPKITRRDFAVALASAFATVAGGQALWSLAVSNGHLGTVSSISVFPFEGAWGALLFGEMLSLRTLSGWGVSMLGIFCLFGANATLGLSSGSAEGYALASGLFFTLGTALRRYMTPGLPDRMVVWLLLVVSIPISALQSATSGEIAYLPTTPTTSLVLLALALVALAINFLMTHAVRTHSLATIGTIFLAKPAISFLSGAFLFGEATSSIQVIGAILVVVGVLFGMNAAPVRAVVAPIE